MQLSWWCFTCEARGTADADTAQREADKHTLETDHATMTKKAT